MDYRSVIEKAPWGYALHRILMDSGGKPQDLLWMDTNPAYEGITGFEQKNLVGQRVSQIFPDILDLAINWTDFSNRTAAEGDDHQREHWFPSLQKWLRIQIYSTEPGTLTIILNDITAEKSRELNLEGFFSVNLDLLCIANLQGEFLLTNPAWQDVLGYTGEELRTRKFLELVHPDDVEATLAAISNLTDQQDVLNFINRYRTKTGTYRYIEWRSHPKGNLIYAAARDVTERMEMEQKLADSHGYTKTLLEALPDMLFVFDQDDRFMDFKSGNTQKLVMPPSAFLGKTAADVLPPMVSDPLTAGLKAVRKTHRPYTFEYEIPMEVGHGHFECRLVPFPPEKIMGLVRDMTETIHAREEAQESASILNRFFEQSTAGYFFMMLDEPVVWNDSVDKKTVMDWVFDHHRMTRINQAMLDQYQSEEKDFLGLTPRDLLGHDLEAGKKVWTEFFDRGRLHVETDERRRNGDPLSVLGDYICLYDELGRITGHFGIQIDITAQKTLEAQLSKSRDESRALAEKATKASQAKSEFLANMSHEIRTPLNGVIGFSELLLKTPLSPLQHNYGENIATSARSLLGVINDILDFSKIEAGKLEVSPVLTDLRELLEQTMVLLQYQADQKGLALQLHIPSDLPRFVWVDPLRLRQVLVNLLGNAVKFTHRGEVELKVGYQETGYLQGQFFFSVRDTGIGIPESQKATLFQAFSQGDASTTRQYGGTGLGLAISSSLTRQMGSPLEVESTQGVGSVFRFSLNTSWQTERDIPAADTLEVPFPEDISRHVKPSPLILLADDVRLNLVLLKSFILHIIPGARILEAANGVEVLKILKEATPDLIFMDIQMPEMDGLEATRTIKHHQELRVRSINTIALTAGVLEEEKQRCLEAGMEDFLTKPMDTQALKNLLLKYLGC